MIGKIDKDGFLLIKRKDNYKPVSCPFTLSSKDAHYTCGDWCALFGKVVSIQVDNETIQFAKDGSIEFEDYYTERPGAVELCKRTLSFSFLYDERDFYGG